MARLPGLILGRTVFAIWRFGRRLDHQDRPRFVVDHYRRGCAWSLGMVKPSLAAAPLPFDPRADKWTVTRVVWRTLTTRRCRRLHLPEAGAWVAC